MFYNMSCWSFRVLNDEDHRFLCCSLSESAIPIGCPCSPGTVHLRSASQLRQTTEYFMHPLKHPCSAIGRNFQNTSHLFHLQEALKQNKISVLDPHLYELCEVCQHLWAVCIDLWVCSCTSWSHWACWSQQEWRGQNILGWQLNMALRSLWISVHLWEANVMFLYLRTGSYFTLNTTKVFLYVTASVFSWLIVHTFIITPSYSSSAPSAIHLCPIPKGERSFSANSGAG